MAQNSDEDKSVVVEEYLEDYDYIDEYGDDYSKKIKLISESNRKVKIVYCKYDMFYEVSYKPCDKTETIYDDEGRTTTISHFGWDDNKKVWREAFRSEYRYNTEGKIIFSLSADISFNVWKNFWVGSKSETYYDDKGYTGESSSWEDKIDEWNFYTKKSETKYLNAYYNWNHENKQWTRREKGEWFIDTVYAADDIEYKTFSYEWDSIANDFVPTYKSTVRIVNIESPYKTYQFGTSFKWDKEKFNWVQIDDEEISKAKAYMSKKKKNKLGKKNKEEKNHRNALNSITNVGEI